MLRHRVRNISFTNEQNVALHLRAIMIMFEHAQRRIHKQ